MTDSDIIIPLRPLGPRRKDPTAAERQRRYRRKKRRAAGKAPVTQSSTPTVTPEEQQTVTPSNPVTAGILLPPETIAPFPSRARRVAPLTIHDTLAVTSALALTGVSAYLSVRGLAVLFPGLSTIVLGAAMECGKLCTVAFLARHLRDLSWLTRSVLAVLVLIIASINGVGVYSQLIALHAGERGAKQAVVAVARDAVDARIAAQVHVVEDVDRRIQLSDRTVEEAAKRGRTRVALDAIETGRKARAALQDERRREATTLVSLQEQRAGASARARQIETEAAPIQYVAALFGVTDPEVAIRWLVLFMTLSCDPLAIALTWSAAARRRNSGP
jgi:hypothetical protein